MSIIRDDHTFIYRVDAQDRIVWTNQEWMDFAQENQAPELVPENVLGERLDRFISGWETRHLYEIIYGRVRQTGRSIHFPFRCDSPGHRRYFQMLITPGAKDELEFEVKVICMEACPTRPLLDKAAARSSEYIVICSWCKKIKIDEIHWCEIEDVVNREELFGDTPPELTHEVCPACLTRIHGQLNNP